MNELDVLRRHLEREIKARKEAEEISERKIGELYRLNEQLNKSIAEHKKTIGKLKKSTKYITALKKLEDKLLKSNQDLEQFAYVASHDLKAPLRAIERLSSWTEEDNADKLDARSKENLALLRQRVSRMSNLIDGILQYSRAGRTDLDIHKVNTRKLLDEVLDSLNPPSEFKILYTTPMPTLNTAKIPLSQVFANLISNSIKYHNRPNGTISIGAYQLDNDFYQFSVSDDGPGIEAEYFEKIFMIFQTLQPKDQIESTGIGLSIVKKIVESQGGHVTVDSTIGKGSTFAFTWPKFSRRRKENTKTANLK